MHSFFHFSTPKRSFLNDPFCATTLMIRKVWRWRRRKEKTAPCKELNWEPFDPFSDVLPTHVLIKVSKNIFCVIFLVDLKLLIHCRLWCRCCRSCCCCRWRLSYRYSCCCCCCRWRHSCCYCICCKRSRLKFFTWLLLLLLQSLPLLLFLQFLPLLLLLKLLLLLLQWFHREPTIVTLAVQLPTETFSVSWIRLGLCCLTFRFQKENKNGRRKSFWARRLSFVGDKMSPFHDFFYPAIFLRSIENTF